MSFATNTNWQGYGGETTMSYLTQMLSLNVQNFVSAAAGMATLVALIRGLARRRTQTIGNFWIDLTRSTLYILLQYNSGPHDFSEILYAYSSMGNNNGSAFAGIGVNNPFYNTTGGICMLLARYWLAIPTLAIAGSLARKKMVPVGPGTLGTYTPLFIVMLIGVVVIVGALSFLPVLALGPIVDHLIMIGAS